MSYSLYSALIFESNFYLKSTFLRSLSLLENKEDLEKGLSP